jgi:mycothiol synthase
MEGVQLRPYAGEADLEGLVRLINAEAEADRVSERYSVGELNAEFRHASQAFDAQRDVTVAVAGNEIVAYGHREWIDTRDAPLREYRTDGAVLPDWRRRGLGRAVLAENERRARALALTHQTHRAKVLGSWSGEHQAGDIALLESSGYSVVRWFFIMGRPTLDDVPDLELPDGLEIRPVTPDLYNRVWGADVEAFRDHWGGHDESPAALQRFLDRPEHDPSLWVVAFDGDEIAGGVLNTIYPTENESLGVRRGWLDSVFTRRPWRRRGLARALIVRSLDVLRQRGMSSAVLGVDAENPTGALGLYEGVGFVVEERSMAWRKPMNGEDAPEADR